MRAELTEGERAKARVRDHLRQCYEECGPFLDKSIPLGKPSLADADVIKRYYARKHARGEFGTYWPLHQLGEAQFGVMRSLGGRK
jgi:hypothetical protein